MRILQVNKYFQLTGGGDRFFFDTINILQAHGHEVDPFFVDYLKTPYDKYFTPGGVGGGRLQPMHYQ
jgi:hypothetical protein